MYLLASTPIAAVAPAYQCWRFSTLRVRTSMSVVRRSWVSIWVMKVASWPLILPTSRLKAVIDSCICSTVSVNRSLLLPVMTRLLSEPLRMPGQRDHGDGEQQDADQTDFDREADVAAAQGFFAFFAAPGAA